MMSDGWFNFVAAFAVFFASHMVLVRPPLRPWLVQHLTQTGFTAGYSILSVAILWWLIEAARTAPCVALWAWSPWQNWAPILVMVPVCLVLSFGLGRPNPFSFGGWRNDRFDPQKPGLIKWVRHPVLVALLLWSTAHMIPNGDLAHVLLFGSFALFSLLGMKIIDRRRQRELGENWWNLVSSVRSARTAPFAHVREDLVRLVAGLALYGLLAFLHPLIAGLDPFAVM